MRRFTPPSSMTFTRATLVEAQFTATDFLRVLDTAARPEEIHANQAASGRGQQRKFACTKQ
jgi:hypothetical protein